ncbi:MAG: hypothetical protein NZ700_04315 [Gemmataceae bacterium]|nr:hypothetical protein [Gemmataceae bacterium]MDW8264796.1 hypothetical protein [Gemmataceae bacterium]
MIVVEAASRLHFGLLSLPPGEPGPGSGASHRGVTRCFGGVGLMVREPGLRLVVQPSDAWRAAGPLAERMLAYARRVAAAAPPQAVRPLQLTLERSAPEHAGLGTGTQLALAVAAALHAAWALPPLPLPEAARLLGRGQRSAIGLHGFAGGGLLVDGGHGPAGTFAPLLVRLEFPSTWRLVLALASADPGLHGTSETLAFQRLAQAPPVPARTDALCRLVLLGLLPAVVERDWAAFSEALQEFNARAGEMFAPVQGGPYASGRIAELVHFVRQQGIPGVGQSSWGPTVFAVAADEEQACDLVRRLRERFALEETALKVTGAANEGARLTVWGEAR